MKNDKICTMVSSMGLRWGFDTGTQMGNTAQEGKSAKETKTKTKTKTPTKIQTKTQTQTNTKAKANAKTQTQTQTKKKTMVSSMGLR